MKIFQTYPGGKGGNGTYQKIINHIPPMETLIIPFLGNCAILRNIKLPRSVIAFDLDTAVTEKWNRSISMINNDVGPKIISKYGYDAGVIHYKNDVVLRVINGDGISFLQKLPVWLNNSSTFIYLDPPYPLMARRSRAKLYNYEMKDKDHKKLLNIITHLNCNIGISTLPNDIYKTFLSNWNEYNYFNLTRRGKQLESFFYNYDLSGVLQDYSFYGDNFRKRARIKNIKKRWLLRLKRMNKFEQNLLMEYLKENL
jgi:hypothetical protein